MHIVEVQVILLSHGLVPFHYLGTSLYRSVKGLQLDNDYII
jgi:hypothetical protein